MSDPRDPKRRSAAPNDSDDANSSESSRWQRPEDRFPTLPGEVPPTAPLKEPPPRQPAPREQKPGSGDNARNLISLFFLLASCGVITYFALIWQNPYSALNPLAPPTPLPLMITATYTPTNTPSPAPTETAMPSITPTEFPSVTPTLTFTPIFLEGFSTPNGTPATEDTSAYRFALQREHVVYITNPAARGGCKWSSIAGSVMNYDGSALNGYSVRIVGGDDVDKTVVTGSAPGFGPGGFEVQLGNAAKDAQYVAQLIDPDGKLVSPVYTVETNSDCDLNIAALRFVETEPSS